MATDCQTCRRNRPSDAHDCRQRRRVCRLYHYMAFSSIYICRTLCHRAGAPRHRNWRRGYRIARLTRKSTGRARSGASRPTTSAHRTPHTFLCPSRLQDTAVQLYTAALFARAARSAAHAYEHIVIARPGGGEPHASPRSIRCRTFLTNCRQTFDYCRVFRNKIT